MLLGKEGLHLLISFYGQNRQSRGVAAPASCIRYLSVEGNAMYAEATMRTDEKDGIDSRGIPFDARCVKALTDEVGSGQWLSACRRFGRSWDKPSLQHQSQRNYTHRN